MYNYKLYRKYLAYMGGLVTAALHFTTLTECDRAMVFVRQEGFFLPLTGKLSP